MVTAPITDNGVMFVNVVNAKDMNANKNNAGFDFAKTMQEVSKKPEAATAVTKPEKVETKMTQTKKEEPKVENNLDSDKEATTSEETKFEEKLEEVTEPEKVEDSITEELKDAIRDAAKDVLTKIAEELDMDEEDIMEVMNCLGMPMTDLLNTESVTSLMVELSGNDMMSLVTNEELYTAVQNVTTELQETLDTLLEEFGMTEEMLEAATQAIESEMNAVDVQSFEQNLSTLVQPEEMPVENTEPAIKIEIQQEKPQPVEKTADDEQVELLTADESLESSDEVATDQKADDESQTEQPQQKNQTELIGHKKEEHTTAHTETGGNTTLEHEFGIDFAEAVTKEDKLYQTSTDDIMKQIMDYMNVKVKEDVTEMEMQLHPASLGTVNLQLTARGGSVTAQFTVQNEAVKSAMETQLVQLKEDLENQGVKVEAVEVTLASHGFERNLNEQNHEQSEQNQQNKVKAARRKIINLNEYDSLEMMEADGDDATRIAMEMMASNGNSLDMLA